MKVYVLERGMDEDIELVGVFATREGAEAAYPAPWRPHHRPGRWWSGGSTYDTFAEISEYELQP